MAKRECGSCRYYDGARDGKQGWCTHPERQESSSVRILVRAAELRCRNDWGHDQWEAKVEGDTVLGVVMNDAPHPRLPRSDRDARPRTDIDIPDIQLPATDVTASPMMPVSRADEAPEPTEATRTVSADLNRELLRGAWERHRERNLNKGYSLDPPVQPESQARVISNQYIPPSRDVDTPASRGLTTSVFEFSDKGNEAKFDAVPEIDEQREVPEIRPAARQQPSQARIRPPAESRRPLPASESRFGELEDPARDDVRPVERETPQVRWPDLDEVARPEPGYSAETPEQSFNGSADNAYETRAESPREILDDQYFEPWEAATQFDHAAREGHDIWANIPRCCRTCRDFRPAGSGERGWCNNQWAFKHRRMVDSDDLPCETSIGHWWVPGDEAWQGEFDVSALGQPTPFMDRWFGRVGGDERTADAAQDRRRRKTGSW